MIGFGEILRSISLEFNDSLALQVLLLIVVLTIVSFFIYEFYQSTSKRNIINLNLRKYNTSNHPVGRKAFAVLLYLLEYILIMPLILILWFTALSFMLLIISDGAKPVEHVLLISAVLIGAIRILAYFKKDISQDLSKLFPFISLSIFLLSIGTSFNLQGVLSQSKEIPLLISNIFSFIVVISFVEISLRMVYTLVEFWTSEDARP